MEFVDNAADENILNEYNIFADAEAFEDVETAAHDCMDLLEGKNVRYTDELNILEEPPNCRNSLEAHEVPHRARAAAPAAAADARSGHQNYHQKSFQVIQHDGRHFGRDSTQQLVKKKSQTMRSSLTC